MKICNRILIPALFVLLLNPAPARAKEFLNTIMHINFGVAYGFPFGDIIDLEHDSYYILQTYEKNKKVRPRHFDSSLGMTIDLVPLPPLILGTDSHALKFGIRGKYFFHYFQQKLTVKEGEKKETEYGGELINYRSWMVGPVIHYAPSIEASDLGGDYTAGGGFTIFALAGPLQEGLLTAFPAQRDNGVDVGAYETKFDGYKIDVGIGAEISICSLNLGINLFYSTMRINMDDVIYSSIGRESRINEFGIELFIGIPITRTVFPRIF